MEITLNTKEKILDSAESLFNSYGYVGVGVDLIRDTSGISKTTIYRYFSDKTGLIIAVLNRRHKRFLDSMISKISSVNSSDEKLTSLLSWHYEWFESENFHGCMFMHALSEFKEVNSEITKVARKHKIQIKILIDAILREAPSTYNESKAIFIMSMLEGLIVNVEFFKSPPPFDLFNNTLLIVAHA